MGCQKDIAGKIIKNEADYVLRVRDNQKLLKQDVISGFERKTKPAVDRKHDLGHGRTEIRTCEVGEDLSLIKKKNEWKGLKSIVKISAERTDKQNGKYSKDNQLLWMINSVPNCRVFKSNSPGGFFLFF